MLPPCRPSRQAVQMTPPTPLAAARACHRAALHLPVDCAASDDAYPPPRPTPKYHAPSDGRSIPDGAPPPPPWRYTPARASPSSWACPTGHTQPDDALHPHSATPSGQHLPRSASPIQSVPPRLHGLSVLGLPAGTVRLLARPSQPAPVDPRPCHRCTTSLTQPRRSALNDRGDPCISRTLSSARGI